MHRVHAAPSSMDFKDEGEEHFHPFPCLQDQCFWLLTPQSLHINANINIPSKLPPPRFPFRNTDFTA